MVSVIIPAYNAEKYIEECITSICNQTYRNLEIIVIDDGSTDNTATVIKMLQKADGRILYFYEDNSGVMVARKRGVEKATGSYICFVDADDYLDENMISMMRRHIETTDVVSVAVYEEKDAGVFCQYYDDFVEGDHYNMQDIYIRLLCDLDDRKMHPVSPWIWNKMYKTEIAKDVMESLPNDLCFAEDTCFVCGYFLKASSISFLHTPLYHYRYCENSAVHKINPNALAEINYAFNVLNAIVEETNDELKLKKQVDCWLQSNVYRAMFYRMNIEEDSIGNGFLPKLSFVKINIYGAGEVGNKLYHYYRGLGIEIIWVDQNYRNINKDLVQSPQVLFSNEFPIVVAVYSKTKFEEIKDFLITSGIANDRIFWSECKI